MPSYFVPMAYGAYRVVSSMLSLNFDKLENKERSLI